jgi:predicted flap endonuclease-1-like 5' DNA nuclease/predicted nucleic-acid-binding Zn-ribbon protein
MMFEYRPILAAPALQAEPVRFSLAGWEWLVIFLLVTFVVWWLIRWQAKSSAYGDESLKPGNGAPGAAAVYENAPAAPPIMPSAPAAVDDLVIIEGIGPKINALLQEAGITTFTRLAATEPARLLEILHAAGLRLGDPTTWPEQARLAAAGDWEGLKRLQEGLKAGRRVTPNV